MQDLVADVGLAPLAGRTSAVVDLDSSAIVSFGNHEGTAFGYAGKGRRRRRHFPLVASVAETLAVVHADYRDGRAIRATEATTFLDRARSLRAAAVPLVGRIAAFADRNRVGGFRGSFGRDLVEACPCPPA